MDRRDAADALLAVAGEQQGYFTAKQAVSAGYSHQHQEYHLAAGNWTRVARGVYRMRTFPPQGREDLAVLSLLSHNRAGEPQAVVSHDSALAIHELSDINPAQVHLTVPPRFRKNMPGGVRLHVARLQPSDWEQRDGYRVTTPLRTIVDVAGSPLSQELLNAAIRDALDRGLIREGRLLAVDTPEGALRRIGDAIEASKQGVRSG
jgi:predicted transcriptional regulator of viral defense system